MKTFSQKFIFGAVLVALVLIGARAPQNSSAQTESAPPADANVPGATDDSVPPATLPLDILPDSPLAQVIRLAQAGVDQGVIMSYISNSSAPFNLTSDQIIYLKDLGLPDEAVNAMIQRDQQLGVATNPTPAPIPETTPQTETPAPPAVVTQNYFYDTLSPYGGWVNVDGYGLCWRPSVVVYHSDWQPYCQHGHWVFTDAGWFWVSDYSWGATTFHYGRWFHHARFGWCWWPDRTWAPSWVCWRQSNEFCGWAPLPPHAIFREGAGIVFNGAVVSAGFDFGISANFFTFVPTRNFCDPHPERFRVPRMRVTTVFNNTTVINNFSEDRSRNTVINNGIPPQRISDVTKTPIRRVAIRETSGSGAQRDQVDRSGNTLVVTRPHFSENTVANLNKGVRPPMLRKNSPSPLIINGNGNNFHPATPGQPAQPERNNFSSPAPSSIPPFRQAPGQNVVTPQTVQPQQIETPHVTKSQNILSAPASPPVAPASHFAPNQQTPNYNYDKRIVSPKQQQIEEQSPRFNSYNSVQRETPVMPAEHPQVIEPRSEPQAQQRNVAPSAPAQSAPATSSGSQKSDKDQNSHGH